MKKILLCVILNLLAITIAFSSGPGLPTFDFSNLLSAIESLTKAVEFYEDTAKKLNEYRLKIEELGRTISDVNLDKILDAIKRGEYNLDIINSYLDELDSKIDNFEEEANNFWSDINNSMYDIVGFYFHDKILLNNNQITESNTIEKIKDHAHEQLTKARIIVHNSQDEINNVINDYEIQKEKLNISINLLKDDIQFLLSSNASSQNAMQMLSIKSKELDSLIDKKNEIDRRYTSQVEKLKAIRNKNQEEFILLSEATTKLINALKNTENLKDKNSKLATEISSYKPKIRFKF